MQKIAITGTKGKTTVVTMTAQALQKLSYNVMHVDTTGHFINGEQLSTLEQSKEIWGLVPSVCPGRYLWEFQSNETLKNDPEATAVLECSVGSSASTNGLGYGSHEIGVFLNVFEDHLGSSDRLKTRKDIAVAKNFVFRRLNRDGVAIFNADDELVAGELHEVPDHFNTSLLPCGINFNHFDIDNHLAKGGRAITVNGEHQVIIKDKQSTTVLCDLKKVPWAFDGVFTPSVYNMLFIAAIVCARTNFKQLTEMPAVLESLRLNPVGGRLTLLKAANGATILADYAHEKESLRVVGELARHLAVKGKTVGVVRLAHDRTDELLKETAHVIADSFDNVIVYDKIDGHFRKPKNVRSKKFPQVVGRTSEIIALAVKERNENCERIIREDEAIQRAAQTAGPDDVVVVIVNDDIVQSIGFIQNSFQAEFV